MIIHNFDPIFIDIGFVQIRWYSIAYILGIILGWIYIKKIIKNLLIEHNFLKISEKNFDDLIIYLVLGIIIGGRLGYVIFYDFAYYSKNLSEIHMVWKGGMSFHGGLLGVIAACFIFSKIKKISLLNTTDLISCAAPIGIFFGRVANFINGELYGKSSDVPWGVIFPHGGNIARHPSQIYEAIFEGIILFILINFFALRKKLILKTGYISSLFLMLYSALRIFSENFREPDEQLGYFFKYFSMGTLLSMCTFVIGCLLIFFIKKNEQNN